jgi:hypothetical protein
MRIIRLKSDNILVLDTPLDSLEIVFKLLSLESLQVVYLVLLDSVIVAASDQPSINLSH